MASPIIRLRVNDSNIEDSYSVGEKSFDLQAIQNETSSTSMDGSVLLPGFAGANDKATFQGRNNFKADSLTAVSTLLSQTGSSSASVSIF